MYIVFVRVDWYRPDFEQVRLEIKYSCSVPYSNVHEENTNELHIKVLDHIALIKGLKFSIVLKARDL